MFVCIEKLENSLISYPLKYIFNLVTKSAGPKEGKPKPDMWVLSREAKTNWYFAERIKAKKKKKMSIGY